MTTSINSISNLFHRFLRNLFEIFSWKNLGWHFLAIVLTYAVVISGFDWQYFKFFRGTWFYQFSFSAAILGALLPLFIPLALFIFGSVKKNVRRVNTALALGQAAILGSLISSFYKSLTGRAFPPQLVNAANTSRVFHFSLFRGGVFWGWPSSHTMIAFAMAVTLVHLYSKNKIIKYSAWLYAFYIGLSVAISIHWFSDFVAGAILGIVIGTVVGKTYQLRLSSVEAKIKP